MIHSLLRRRRTVALLALLIAALAATFALRSPSLASAIQTDPVTAAWEKARAAGSYEFDSDITQVTIPVAKLTNVGRSSSTETLHLEGASDLLANRLELQIWSDSGSVLQKQGSLAIKVENGKTFTRQSPTSDWKQTDTVTTDSFAPHGDFMTYLKAIRAVQAHAAEVRNGIQFTRYSFRIDGPTFAAYVRDQLEAAMRARGELPPDLPLSMPSYYHDMTGDGELWVGVNGLPLRQVLHLQFPEQKDQQVQTQIVVDFSHFATPQPTQLALLRAGDGGALGATLAAALSAAMPLWIGLSFLALALLLLTYRRSRRLYNSMALAVILSMVIGPLLSTYTHVKFFDAQTVKAAAQEEKALLTDQERSIQDVLGKVEFNPHLNPLETVKDGQWESAGQAPVASLQAAPLAVGIIPPSGISNWWAGDGGPIDIIGGKDGTLNGKIGFVPGKVDQAFNFTGENGYVALPDNVFPFPTIGTANTPFSFELWFKTDASGVILGQQIGTPYTAIGGYVPALYVDLDGLLRTQLFWGGAINQVISTNVVNDSLFHHVALVYNGTSQTAYLDGATIGSTALTQTAYGSSYSYQLGTGYTSNWPKGNNGWSNFRGQIDEPTLYNRALNQAEVQASFNAGSIGKNKDLADSDGDGLTNFQEQRIGTDALNADSDGDSIPDGAEVRGFSFGGKQWYPNSFKTSTLDDGIPDGMKWDGNPANVKDTNGNGTPDLFDADIDSDSVPNNLDKALFTRLKGFEENNPLKLTLNHLEQGKPTFVDFQVRPTNDKHLWFAYNVLDWPHDSEGQIQDVDNKTFADTFAAQGKIPAPNDSNGDMKLIPMLEIRIQGATTNLPAQSDLLPYDILVSNYAPGVKAVYVPVSLVTDEKTGARVAFEARMLYLPGATWPAAHDVRLAWTVQALTDIPCDPKAANASAVGCQADSYIHNVAQVVQTYYDSFSLTGMNVEQDLGASAAIINADPASLTDKKDDSALWALSYGLNNSFLTGRDQDNNGQRDLTVSEIARRFNRTTNSGVSDAQRWNIPNILQVTQKDYATLDLMVYNTITDTRTILDTQFKPVWQADSRVKPLLMFASEARSRTLSLNTATTGGYLALSSNSVTFDMQPTGQPMTAVETSANLKWSPYCPGTGSAPSWDICLQDSYMLDLESRYSAAQIADDPVDANGKPLDADLAGGRMLLLQLYGQALYNGTSQMVQVDNKIQVDPVKTVTDSEAAVNVRGWLSKGNSAIKTITSTTITFAYDNNLTRGQIVKNLGKWWRLTKSGLVDSATEVARLFRNFSTNGHLDRLKAVGIIGGITVGIALLATIGTYYYQGAWQAKLTFDIVSKVAFAGIAFYFSSISKIQNVVKQFGFYKAGGFLSTSEILSRTLTKTVAKGAKIAAAVGATLSIGITWGFFIHNVASGQLSATDPAFGKELATAIATTIFIIFSALVSATVIGSIVQGFIALIDGILQLACSIDKTVNGDSVLTQTPGYDGECFTLNETAIKAIAYFLYNFDIMVNPDVSAGGSQTKLADPNKGFVAGNTISISMPMTTTIVHKDPDPLSGIYINFYLYLFSPDNLRATTFQQNTSISAPATLNVELDQMKNLWQNVREEHKYVLTPMYGASASAPLIVKDLPLSAGINQPANFYINTGYALPAYECIGVPNILPVWTPPVIPVCYYKKGGVPGSSSTLNDNFKFDVFPATLDGFMTLGGKSGGGQGLAWDATFPALRDPTGLGLLSQAYGGLSPSDSTWNLAGDGISDARKLQLRQTGVNISLTRCNSDGDPNGLTNAQKLALGLNPASQDTDHDGLTDAQEVWHQVYDFGTCQPKVDATGKPIWAGGWDIVINSTPTLSVHVSSNPLVGDSAGDGISDLAKFQLRDKVDKEGRVYNPNIINTSPIAIYTQVSDPDRVIGLNQRFTYTTTVEANFPAAPGVLTVGIGNGSGIFDVPATANYALGFNPLTFNTVQSINQEINLQTPAGLALGTSSRTISFTSSIRTRLAPTSSATWVLEPVQTMGSFASPYLTRYTAATAGRIDRADSYKFVSINTSGTPKSGAGALSNVTIHGLPTGWSTTPNLYDSITNNPGNVACNSRGNCMVVADSAAATSGASQQTAPQVRCFLVKPDGVVYSAPQCQSQESAIPSNIVVERRRPAVASNGDTFLVAYEADVLGGGQLVRTVVRAISDDGTMLGTTVVVRSNTVLQGSTQLYADLAWMGDRYRLVYVETGKTTIRMTDFDKNGGLLADKDLILNAPSFFLDDFNMDPTPRLAYDSSSGRWLLTYLGNGTNFDKALLYPNVDSTTPLVTTLIGAGGKQVRVAYQGQSRHWLVTKHTKTDDLNAIVLNGPDLKLLANRSLNKAGSTLPGDTLACPAISALPVVDLRFEEVPGATSFIDSSGNGNNATCTGVSCPAAGLPGAVNAQNNPIGEGIQSVASDYATQFDGNHFVTVNRTLTNDFSVAFWMKTNSTTTGGTLIDQSNGTGWQVVLGNAGRSVDFRVRQSGILASHKPLNDQLWHFIVVTREQSSGKATLYVDGVAVGTATLAAGALNDATDIRIGKDRLNSNSYRGQLDGVQFYATPLAADTVQQIYNSALFAYCVVARPSATGNTIEWSRFYQPDVRGGFITAQNSLNVTLDLNNPTATLNPIGGATAPYVQGAKAGTPAKTIIIGGTASDPTSGIAGVRVAVLPANFQNAAGLETWVAPIQVQEGQYNLALQVTDQAGNQSQQSLTKALIADATPPQVTITDLPVVAIVPVRNADGQWQVTLRGSATDPAVGPNPGSGVAPQSVKVLLSGQDGTALGNGWQITTFDAVSGTWLVNYIFGKEQADPTGTYTVKVQAADRVGNQSADDAATGTLKLDVTGPTAQLTQTDVAANRFTDVITTTVTLGGVISDTGSAGVGGLDLAFVPITQVMAVKDAVVALPFDDVANSFYFQDSSGQFNDGSCTAPSCPTAGVAGRIDNAVQFDGNDDFLTVKRAVSDNFSIALWIKAKSGVNNNSIVIDQGANLTNGWTLWLGNGQAGFLVGQSGLFLSPARIDNDQWHFVTATRERATGKAVLYVDGLAVNATTFSAAALNAVSNLRLGGDRNNARDFSGALDQVQLFNRTLSGAEVQALYQAANRQWFPATLGSTLAKPASTWTAQMPAGLEGLYQIDLRTVDATLSVANLNGNRLLNGNVWRGLIDTVAPRLTLTGRATGQSYLDTATNTQRYEIAYTCRADDFQLNEAAFTCAGNAQRPPAKSFNNDPLLKQPFPDLTLLTTLVNTYTVWAASPTPTGSLTACDAYSHCTTVNATTSTSSVAAAASATVDSGTVSSAAVAGAPQTALLAPTAGSVVNSTGAVQVSVAAQADQPLREIVILLDNAPVNTISFAQRDNVKRTVQTASVTVATAGTHTLSTRATDWSGAQSQPVPVTFVVDRQAPVVTLSNSQLTKNDSYGAQSNILRFRGTASDDTGLVAVQVKVGDQPYADATFGNGVWQTAYPVTDPEGKQLAVKVRARDAAGNVTEISQPLGTDLSVADAPDTTLGDKPTAPSGPPSNSTSAGFSFSGSTTAVAFECQLDDTPAVPCTSPWTVNDLSNGGHTVKVAAINGQGFQDLTPASHTWTVNVTTLATTLTAKPEAETTSRNASFSFTANGAGSFECRLDGGAYAACASPKNYDKLGNGNHTFLVRAVGSAGSPTGGPATRYLWRVTNAAPTVVGDQVAMVVENGAVNVTLQGTDSDALTFQILEQPQHGFLLGLAPNLTYVPNTGYAGPDRFTYRAWDGEAASTAAAVNITVRLGKYAVFAGEGVAFEQNSAVVRGDVGVNAKSAGPFLRNNVEASFSQNSAMQNPSSRVLADSIVVDNNGVIYNPSYNDLTGKGVVNGTRTTPLALPLRSGLPTLPTITAGTQAVAVSGSQTLAAGSYGALTVNGGATLVLSGGLYHFASWNLSQGAKVHFAAPSEVRIAGALLANQNVFVGPTPGATNVDANSIIIHIAGTDGQSGPGNQPRSAAFDQNVVVTAYIVAPNGMINFRQNVNATGAFIGKWVLAEQNSKVTRPSEPATGTATGEMVSETTVVTPTLSETSVVTPTVDATPVVTTTVSETPVVTTTIVVTAVVDVKVNGLYLPLITAGAVSNSVTSTPALTVTTPVTEPVTTTVTNTITTIVTDTVQPESIEATPTLTTTVPVTPTDAGQASTAATTTALYLPLVAAEGP